MHEFQYFNLWAPPPRDDDVWRKTNVIVKQRKWETKNRFFEKLNVVAITRTLCVGMPKLHINIGAGQVRPCHRILHIYTRHVNRVFTFIWYFNDINKTWHSSWGLTRFRCICLWKPVMFDNYLQCVEAVTPKNVHTHTCSYRQIAWPPRLVT